MIQDIYLLCHTKNGKIFMSDQCDMKIALMYGTISRTFALDDFSKFRSAVDSCCVERYFKDHPGEEKIHFHAGYKDLFFSFTMGEIRELRQLMADGWFKFMLRQAARKHVN